MKPETIERLDRFGIGILSEGQHFCAFFRNGCLAVAPWDRAAFSGIGSTGLSLDRGLAYLITRDGRHLLAGNDFEVTAEPEQVEKILQFSADLKAALGLDS